MMERREGEKEGEERRREKSRVIRMDIIRDRGREGGR